MIDEDDASHSCHEHVSDTTILESKEIVDNNEEEEKEEQVEHKEEQIEHIEQVEYKEKSEPLANTSLSNDKEVSCHATVLRYKGNANLSLKIYLHKTHLFKYRP